MQEPTSQEIYRGKLVTLRIQTVPQPIGGTNRFEIVEHPDAVAVVALRPDPSGKPDPLVALVRQPRPAIARDTWEIPAGLMKPEDARNPQLTATRELREETGYTASVWLKLSREYPSPSFSTSAITIYLASGLERAAEVPIAAADPAYQEVSEVRWMPLREALALCRSGEIEDGKTVLGLYLAQDALGKKSQETTIPATGGGAMPLDPTNPPFRRPLPVSSDDGEPGKPLKYEPSLKIDSMLLEEFNYAGQTAYQAMEDRARIFQLYLLLIGVLGSGLGAAYQLGGKEARLQPLVLALLLVGGLLGTAFFISLLRLRDAHQNSLVAMNKVKEYYIKHFVSDMDDLKDAFAWRLDTIPKGEKLGSVFFVVCHTVAMLGSLCFAGIAVVIWTLVRSGDASPLFSLPAELQPYALALVVFGVVFLLHALYFQLKFRSKSRPAGARK